MRGELLLKPQQVNSALINSTKRNEVIRNLGLFSLQEPKRIPRIILAFWLGDSSIIRLLRPESPYFKMVKIGYLCLLTLEKNKSLLSSVNASIPGIQSIHECQLDLLLYYNAHYQLLLMDSQTFLKEFQERIERLSVDVSCSSKESEIILQIKKKCHSYLSVYYEWELHQERTLSVIESFQKMQFSPGRWANQVFTQSVPLHPFFSVAAFHEHDEQQYLMRTLLLPSHDGLMLEGLDIKRRGTSSKTVILALVGHFQFEHSYISNEVRDFCDFFGAEVVFINHRNYAQRSAKSADNIDDLGRDVVTFARYFKEKNKEIVLYGMCGGSAHIALAAQFLTDQKIPYKLIVDRFSKAYRNFFDIKTMMLPFQFYPVITPGRTLSRPVGRKEWTEFFTSTFVIFLMKEFILLLAFISKNRSSFSDVVSKLPATDILILQARASKDTPIERQCVDLTVHRSNDLREVNKEARRQIKNRLRTMQGLCSAIVTLIIDNEGFSSLFKKLVSCFDDYLHLISDEKLIGCINNSPGVHEIHSIPLPKLSTRSGVPLKTYVRGFFAQHSSSCKMIIDELQMYSVYEIMDALQDSRTHYVLNAEAQVQLAQNWADFLSELVTHKAQIIAYANRAIATKLSDISVPLQQLLNSELYQSFSHLSHSPTGN